MSSDDKPAPAGIVDRVALSRLLKICDEDVSVRANLSLAKQRERVLNEQVREKNDSRKLFSEYDVTNDVYFATEDPLKTMAFRASDNTK
jgi:hypothetical protein